jgi:hypothetical protein
MHSQISDALQVLFPVPDYNAEFRFDETRQVFVASDPRVSLELDPTNKADAFYDKMKILDSAGILTWQPKLDGSFEVNVLAPERLISLAAASPARPSAKGPLLDGLIR